MVYRRVDGFIKVYIYIYKVLGGLVNYIYIIYLNNICLYQFNNTSKSYPGAQNTYSIVYSFGWWWLSILLRWTMWSIYWRASPLISQHTSGWYTKYIDVYLVYWTRKHAVGITSAVIIHWWYLENKTTCVQPL